MWNGQIGRSDFGPVRSWPGKWRESCKLHAQRRPVGGIGLQIPARSYSANQIQCEFLPRYVVPLNRLQEPTGPHRHAAILKKFPSGACRWCSSIAPLSRDFFSILELSCFLCALFFLQHPDFLYLRFRIVPGLVLLQVLDHIPDIEQRYADPC